MKLSDYQKKHGLRRIDFSKISPVDKKDTHATDEMICPYCGGVIDMADINLDRIINGAPVYCGWCEKNFYVEAEISVHTTCTPIENKVLDSEHYIKAHYEHLDACAAHNVDFDAEITRGNIEWDTYYEYAKPLFENAENE